MLRNKSMRACMHAVHAQGWTHMRQCFQQHVTVPLIAITGRVQAHCLHRPRGKSCAHQAHPPNRWPREHPALSHVQKHRCGWWGSVTCACWIELVAMLRVHHGACVHLGGMDPCLLLYCRVRQSNVARAGQQRPWHATSWVPGATSRLGGAGEAAAGAAGRPLAPGPPAAAAATAAATAPSAAAANATSSRNPCAATSAAPAHAGACPDMCQSANERPAVHCKGHSLSAWALAWYTPGHTTLKEHPA